VAILAAALGVGVYLGRFVDRRLAAAIAKADRDDPAWRLNDLMAARETVPDAENAALLVAEIVELLPDNCWPRSAKAPGTPDAAPRNFSDHLEGLNTIEPNVRLDAETVNALRQEMAAHQDAVRLARTLTDYRRGRHELELTPALLDTSLEETQNTRLVARLLMVDAAVRAHDGDIDWALDSCRAIRGACRSIGDEPMLISGLVRIAIGGVAMNSARRVIAQGQPSDHALAALQSTLFDELKQPLLLQAFKGERAIYDEIIRRLRDGEIPISALTEGGASGGPVPPVAPWGRLHFDHQRAVGLEWMTELVRTARRPPHIRAPMFKAWNAEVKRVMASPLGKYGALLPLLIMPGMEAANASDARYQAELGSMVIFLAAERHRLNTGQWPRSVDAIERALLPKPPLDPFTGQPLRIERREGTFLVHSVGPNLRDEQGAYEPKRWLSGATDDIGTGGWDPSLRAHSANP
jgi:hypothetical protein